MPLVPEKPGGSRLPPGGSSSLGTIQPDSSYLDLPGPKAYVLLPGRPIIYSTVVQAATTREGL